MLKYEKMDENYEKQEIDLHFIEYCHRDIEVIEKAFIALVNAINSVHYKWINEQILKNGGTIEDLETLTLYKLPLTLPALAKKIFIIMVKLEFGEEIYRQIYDENAEEYTEYFRQFYFGGRVECWNFNVCYNGTYNDENSAYPAMMKDYAYPLAPYTFYENSKNKSIQQVLKRKDVFGCICEFSETNDKILIPIRILHKNIEKIMYPIGKKVSFLFREEIEYLLSINVEIRVIKICCCDNEIYIFKTFIEITFAMRVKYQKEKNDIFAYILKIFMNALYGKFAENNMKEDIQMVSYDSFMETEYGDYESEIIDLLDEKQVMLRIDKKMHVNINIFIAMRITALQRLTLFKAALKENTYYLDTDSITTEKQIENSKELGHFKPELVFGEFQALSCKEYVYTIKNEFCLGMNVFECEIKMKGFSKSIGLGHSPKTFVENYFLPKKGFRPAGLFEIIKRNLSLGEILVYEKCKSSVYDKRWILSNLKTKAFNIETDNFEKMILNNEKIIHKIVKYWQKRLPSTVDYVEVKDF